MTTETTPVDETPAPTVSVTAKRGVITIGGKELVTRFKHYYPPHLYGIRNVPGDNGQLFDIYPFPYQIPTFVPLKEDGSSPLNFNKHRIGNRIFFTDKERYESAREAFNFEHRIFTMRTEYVLKKDPNLLSIPATFVTQAFLYSKEEWDKGAPTIDKDPETGDRIVIDEGNRPDPLTSGLAFCSLKETSYTKALGRDISLGRAIKSYKQKYL